MTSQQSPWSLTDEKKATIDAAREQNRAADEAAVDAMLAQHYQHQTTEPPPHVKAFLDVLYRNEDVPEGEIVIEDDM